MNMKNRKLFGVVWVALILFIFSVFPAVAEDKKENEKTADRNKQEAAVELDTITVTAKRYESEQIETPAFTTVITEQEMERLGGDSAYELLQRSGGVSFLSHMPFGIHMGSMTGSIGLRGLQDGELVLLNGAPLIDPSYGYYDIDMIPSAFLERIEVVKGAGSTLYGSRAMTGTVSLQLKEPGEQAYGGEIMGGSHGSVDTSVYYQDPRFVIGGYYARSDELTDLRKYYTASAPYNTSALQWDRAASLLSFKPWDCLTITHMYNFLDSGWDRDYYTNKTQNYDVLETGSRHYLFVKFEKNGLKITPFFTHNHFTSDYKYVIEDKPEQNWETHNYTTGLDAQQKLNFMETDILVGMSYYYENQDVDDTIVSGSSESGYSISHQIMKNDRHRGSMFVRVEHEFRSRLQLAAGVRLVGVWETEEDSDNYYRAVPQFQALYRLNDNNSIYFNVGRAFEVPAFGYMYRERSNFAPNPDLKPEQGWTYEVGWKWEYGAFSGALAGFYMDYEDKLGSKYMNEIEKYQYQNMDEFHTIGVEWQLRYRFLENFTLSIAGFAADPVEKLSGVEQQAGPKYQLSPGIEYRDRRFFVGLNADMYFERERYLEDYINVHANASYLLTKHIKLKLDVNNLLDDRDLMIYGNMTPQNNSIYATYDPGIWVMGGLEVLF